MEALQNASGQRMHMHRTKYYVAGLSNSSLELRGKQGSEETDYKGKLNRLTKVAWG